MALSDLILSFIFAAGLLFVPRFIVVRIDRNKDRNRYWWTAHRFLCCLAAIGDPDPFVRKKDAKLRCYVLDDCMDQSGKLYLAFGYGAVDAAEKLIEAIGGSKDPNRFSVSGMYDVTDRSHIVLSEYWPHFTSHPNRHSRP